MRSADGEAWRRDVRRVVRAALTREEMAEKRRSRQGASCVADGVKEMGGEAGEVWEVRGEQRWVPTCTPES